MRRSKAPNPNCFCSFPRILMTRKNSGTIQRAKGADASVIYKLCTTGLPLGVLFDIPTIGCAKSCLIGQYASPGDRRGDYSLLTHESETIGAVLRTQDGRKPVFASIGRRISLSSACAWLLRLAPPFRLFLCGANLSRALNWRKAVNCRGELS